MNALAGVESWGSSPANTLAVKFSDDSVIAVPVLKPDDVAPSSDRADSTTAPPPDKSTGKKFAFLRRHSSSRYSCQEKSSFAVRDITRLNYLKYYAKDDHGRYIGTERPADDCILRGDDLMKYRHAHEPGTGHHSQP